MTTRVDACRTPIQDNVDVDFPPPPITLLGIFWIDAFNLAEYCQSLIVHCLSGEGLDVVQISGEGVYTFHFNPCGLASGQTVEQDVVSQCSLYMYNGANTLICHAG